MLLTALRGVLASGSCLYVTSITLLLILSSVLSPFFSVPKYSYFLRKVSVWPPPISRISVRSQGSPGRAKTSGRMWSSCSNARLELVGIELAADQVSRRRVELVGLFLELFGSLDRLHLVLLVEHDRVDDLAGQLEQVAQEGEGLVVDLGVGVARVEGQVVAPRERELGAERFNLSLDRQIRIAAPLADRKRRNNGSVLVALDLHPHQGQDLMRLRCRFVRELLPLGEFVLELDLGLGLS